MSQYAGIDTSFTVQLSSWTGNSELHSLYGLGGSGHDQVENGHRTSLSVRIDEGCSDGQRQTENSIHFRNEVQSQAI